MWKKKVETDKSVEIFTELSTLCAEQSWAYKLGWLPHGFGDDGMWTLDLYEDSGVHESSYNKDLATLVSELSGVMLLALKEREEV